jgi:pimeloyl-ACP methyl ester carboxylesterase
MRMTARRGGILALATSLALVGCTSPVENTEPVSLGSYPAEWASYYEQKLTWQDCEEDFVCADVDVPLDWSDPSSPAISIALIKHEATTDSLGALFVNPGGPGASGVSFVADSIDYVVSKEVKKRYDVIGFDPRGIGQSDSVECFDTDAQVDEFLFGTSQTPRASAQWFEERQASIDEFVSSCSEKSGDLLTFLDSVSAARDMDVLRYVTDNRYLNFAGFSYGTLLGALYAEEYPGNVGKFVLDGAMNPASTSADVSLSQAVGFESALRAYLTDCMEQTTCPFSGTVDQAMSDITQLLQQLDVTPLSSSDPRLLGADAMVTAIAAPLYTPDAWPFLTEVFTGVLQGDPENAWIAVDWYYNRVEGEYQDNSTEAFIAVNCLDYPVSDDPAQWAADASRTAEAAPVIGPYLAWGEQLCLSWPAYGLRTPTPVSATGSAPIVVIGTTGDPATPYHWAVELADQLSNARLITYEGEGHTAYNKGVTCVDDAVDAYLVQGVIPPRELLC